MSTREAGGAEVLFGVSLRAMARVHAAERAGVPAEERLAEMGLDRGAFSRAEQAWSERLSRSLREDPALFVAYDAALAEALAEDAPRLVPLEDELGAWVSFEGHFQRALDPAEVAAKVGLTLAEVARLHRTWAERLAADPALAEEAVQRRAEEPAPLQEVKREPRVVRRAVVGEGASPVMPQRNTPVVQVVSAPTPMSTGTADINLAALFQGKLPFDPNASRPPGAAPPSPSPSQASPPRREPLFTGTSAVDLSQLRAGAVPFPTGAPGAHSMNSDKGSPSQVSTETTELDLRAMFGGGAPLPFQVGGAQDSRAPSPPAPVAPVPAPVGPQGGSPGKDRPFEAGTTEVDAALVAAALKKGPAPFKK